MTDTVLSVNKVPIRLTDERWAHITEHHSELAGFRSDVSETILAPEKIVEGGDGALMAVRRMPSKMWLVVVYRELVDDGFVVTAFLTNRARSFEKRSQVWP